MRGQNLRPRRPSRPSYQFLRSLYRLGYRRIVGVDEVGRGALCGPICVAAVELTKKVAGVTDSKLVAAHRRTSLCKLIKRAASQISLGWVSHREIDRFGVTKALGLAYERALEGIEADLILTDHYRLPATKRFLKAAKGDRLFYPVAAASIVAKVCRDQLMKVYSLQFPQFGWGQNVGYDTAYHRQAIISYGPTQLHRQSFLRIKKGRWRERRAKPPPSK